MLAANGDGTENRQADRESGKLSPKATVIAKLNEIIGQEIVNRETGIVATLGRRGINKMVSNRAVNKSLANGYSQSQHLQAAKRIKELYEQARLVAMRPDRNQDSNISSIKIFGCDIMVESKAAFASITVKESIVHGHKIYSVELMQLESPRS